MVLSTLNLFEGKYDDLISDPNINDDKDLEEYIMKNIGQAFTDLIKDKLDLVYPVKATLRRDYINFEGKSFSGDELGFMKYGFKNVWINTFSGGKMPKGKKDGDTYVFHNYIWFTIHYSYEHGTSWTGTEGSNGCSLYFPKETSHNIFYSIIDKKFYTNSEAIKLNV